MENEQRTTTETAEVITPVVETMPVEVVSDTAPIIAAPTAEYVKISVTALRRYAYAFFFGLMLIGVAFLFSKGYFVAATVDGSPISRLAVVQALEKQGGKQTLEVLIHEKLIKAAVAKSGVTISQADIDAKLKEIEAQVAAKGGTLADALAKEGATVDQLKEQIQTQLQLKQILGDKVAVTADEVDAFIKDNKITQPKDMSADEFKKSVNNQLSQQKFQTESQKWIADVTEAAKIKYYVTY